MWNDGVCTIRRRHIDAPKVACWVNPSNRCVCYSTSVLTDELKMTILTTVSVWATHESMVNATISKRTVCLIDQKEYTKVNYDVHILVSSRVVAGANETPRICLVITCWSKALLMTVGITALTSGDRVPCVRSIGPTPMMPSTP